MIFATSKQLRNSVKIIKSTENRQQTRRVPQQGLIRVQVVTHYAEGLKNSVKILSFLILGFRGGGTAAEETLQSDDVIRSTEGRSVETGFVKTADDVVGKGIVDGAAVNGFAIIIIFMWRTL